MKIRKIKEVVFRSQDELINESIRLEIRSFQLFHQLATKTIRLVEKNHWEQLSRDEIRHKVLLNQTVLDTLRNTDKNTNSEIRVEFDEIQVLPKTSRNKTLLIEAMNNKLQSIALYKQLLTQISDNYTNKIISKILFDEECHLEFLQENQNHPIFKCH